MKKLSSTPVFNLFLKRRPPKREETVLPPQPERTVHETLSDFQAAYAVFVPRPDYFFNLFDIICIHPVRRLSPRNANANLKQMFQKLIRLNPEDGTGDDHNLVKPFMEEFKRVRHRKQNPKSPRKPQECEVSEAALRKGGFSISAPGVTAGGEASKSKISSRHLSLSWLSSDSYTGQKELQKLIWNHAQEVFLLMLPELEADEYVKTAKGDKSLIGIVTHRLISNVGVSQVDESGAAVLVEIDVSAAPGGGGVQGGAESKKVKRRAYDNLYGVSGLHFIAFRVECLERHRWKFYRGIDVCDSELDETDAFSQAYRWLCGSNTAQSAYKTVTDEDSTASGSSVNEKNADPEAQVVESDPEFVVVTNEHPTEPFVDIDIRPILSEFASKQCKLAAYYRKTDRDKSENIARAVSLLRSALRKCRFESTVRALYDLSGCYVHGHGVQPDNSMARLLRYCAGGFRRNYDTRDRWLRLLMTEIDFRPDTMPERRIMVLALLCRPKLAVCEGETHKYLERCAKNDRRVALLVQDDTEIQSANTTERQNRKAKPKGKTPGKIQSLFRHRGEKGLKLDAVRAKELCEEAIKEGGDVGAMYNLAELLQKGAEGVDVEAVRAKELYEEAIKEGRHVGAMYKLALLLCHGAEGVDVDAVRAKELFEEAIKEGRHVRAMYNLGALLSNGAEGVDVDAVRAKKLYEEAIKEGRHVGAMYKLALLLRNGAEGVDVDAVRAKELFEEAIKEGRHVRAMYNLGVLLSNGAEGVDVDAVRAKELYEEAIKEGRHVRAMNNLGALLSNGAEGVDVDAVRAKELYEEAIKEGRHVGAMDNLGVLLKNGAEGVDVDAVRAKELFEEAIKEGGDVGAMYNLGVLLKNGAEGVDVDAVRAKELFEEAIKEGRHVGAMYKLALLLRNGAEGVDVDAVRAKELFEEAIKEGRHVRAMYKLALLLWNGAEGVDVDAVRAKELFEEAIKEGRHVRAMYNLGVLLKNGAEGVDVDAVRAKELHDEAIKEDRIGVVGKNPCASGTGDSVQGAGQAKRKGPAVVAWKEKDRS